MAEEVELILVLTTFPGPKSRGGGPDSAGT